MKVTEVRKLLDQADRVFHVDFRRLPATLKGIKRKIVRHNLITEGIYTCKVEFPDGTVSKECYLQI